MTPQHLVQKLWTYCTVLRDDGLSYGDYVEQLTYLLFLKMAHERTGAPWRQPSAVPAGLDWPALLARDGDALEAQYRRTLEALGRAPGMLGLIFRKAQNRVQDPAELRRLVADLIGREQWTALDADVKRDAYEGLLAENAQDTKGGAGQYFTPRALIQAVVECAALDRRERRHPKLDALARDPGERFDLVLTNPPFGRKSSVRMVGADGEEGRQDLTVVADLPAPEAIAAEIVEDLRAALAEFEQLEAALGASAGAAAGAR